MTKFCDEVSHTSTIVALGESTHGTREFTKIRAQIVKELISNNGFRIFILEADYLPCQQINNFLKTGTGNPSSLLKKTKIWPWIHTDFLNLLEWIRNYNLNNASDPVLFYGMDTQLTHLFNLENKVRIEFKTQIEQLNTILKSNKKPKRLIENIYGLTKSTNNVFLKYYLLGKIDSISNSGTYYDINSRDKNMAIMVNGILQTNHGAKAVIWAHNGHIMKNTPKYSYYTPLGNHLYDKYENKYTSIGLDFCDGVFRAVDLENRDTIMLKNFTLSTISNKFCADINLVKEFQIIHCDTLKNKITINHIGAGYVRKPLEKMRFYTELKKCRELDYLIVLKSSSATIALE